MTTFTLTLRRCRDRLPERAWLVSGTSPSGTLAELSTLPIALGDLRLFALGGGDEPAWLVVPPAPTPPRPRHARWQPLGLLGERLYVPVDSRLWPPVDDQELDALLALPVNVLLPGRALVGFEPGDALPVADLLAPPPDVEARWDLADPGIAGPPPLRAVTLPALPPLEDLLEDARGDIASESPETLPPAPSELPRRGAGRRWLARMLRRVTARMPHTASRRTWVNAVEDWAGRVLHADLMAARQRELERLLRLLDDDPDRGLCFALPVRDVPGRGVAPSSGALSRRTPEFDARRLHGGRPVDVWAMDARGRAALIERYRQLANRELALGRPRRAAYVFAELLGDEHSAANALEQGGHVREAAQLHRERLRNPAAAVACLRRGGLLSDALALCRELGDLRQTAELLGQLERHDEATAVWRQLVHEEIERDEVVAAARVLEQQLDAADEALALLEGTWPEHPRAEDALRETFALLQRLGRHGRARTTLEGLARTAWPEATATALVRVVAHLARHHADDALRALASDRARVLIGAQVAEGSPSSESLLRALRALDPADRLLARDVDRHATMLPERARVASPPRRPGVRLELVKELAIGVLDDHAVLAGDGRGLWRLDTERPTLRFVSWSGRSTKVARWAQPAARTGLLELMRDRNGEGGVFAALLGDEPHLVPRKPVVDGRRCSVGTLLDCDSPRGVHHRSGITWLVDRAPESDGMLLRGFAADGTLQSTTPVDVAVPAGPVPMVMFGGHLWVVIEGRLLRIGPSGTAVEAVRGVRAVKVSPPHGLPRLVVACERECLLLTGHEAEGRWQPFARDAVEPKVAFTAGGLIVVASDQALMVVQTFRGTVTEVLRDDDSHRHATGAVLPGPGPHEFAVLRSNGYVRLLRVSGL